MKDEKSAHRGAGGQGGAKDEALRTDAILPQNAMERKPEIVKPFKKDYFSVHNAVFDVIMPALSPNAWKILCVAIRQTWGWAASEGEPGDRKKWDRISYSQFQEKAGIGGKATVQRALEECLESGYLVRRQEGVYRGKPVFSYALNLDYELKLPTGSKMEPVNDYPQNGTSDYPQNGTSDYPQNEGNKIQRKPKKEKGGGGPSDEKVVLLTAFGVSEGVAKSLAAACGLNQVRGWVAYAENAHGLRDPVALVVARLRAGEQPPKAKVKPGSIGESSEERRRRYTGGKFGEFIKC
jgi:hypothetical protein